MIDRLISFELQFKHITAQFHVHRVYKGTDRERQTDRQTAIQTHARTVNSINEVTNTYVTKFAKLVHVYFLT